MVFDNAPDPEALRPYLPAAGKAHIIITTTRHTMSSLGAPIPVDVFTSDQALAYLTERTGIHDDGPAPRELATELGHLPLALAQAAAVITTERLTYGAYLRRLREHPARRYLTATEEDPYLYGVADAILLSQRTARDTDPTGLAIPLIDLISLLASAGVTRDLLHTAATTAALTPSDTHAAPASADDVDTALGHLAASSLLTFTLDNSAVTAHRLVTRVAREELIHTHRLSAAGAVAVAILRKATLAAEPIWKHPVGAKDLTQHIMTVATHLGSTSETVDGLSTELLDLRGWALRSLNELADSPAQAIRFGRALTADCQRVLGRDHPDTLTSRNNLAYAYRSAGRLGEAIPLYQEVLAGRGRVLGPDHPDTLTCRNDLAGAYQSAGRLGEAIPLSEQTLTDCEWVLGPDHPDTLTSRNNLAYAYRSAGRLGEAIPLYQQVLADRERLLGLDHPDTLTSRNDLACVYRSAGRLGEDIPLFEQALADCERVLVRQQPFTI